MSKDDIVIIAAAAAGVIFVLLIMAWLTGSVVLWLYEFFTHSPKSPWWAVLMVGGCILFLVFLFRGNNN